MAILEESDRLKRELGLFHVFSVSAGAMFSSGLFLLPGLAAAKTGASVALAYVVAALLMVPAMLSKSELATAMPRAGGAYYFLDRALGPMVGTVGGLATWLVMSLKSSFALIGMGAYLALVVDVPIRVVALGLVAVFTLLNIFGVKQTVRLQGGLVLCVLGVLALLVGQGVQDLLAPGRWEEAKTNFSPFLASGWDGFLATVGFVIVSYAGLTKVASVSEEVRDPERNIPLGMFLSLGAAAVAYTLGISIMTAVIPPGVFQGSLTPAAEVAARASGWVPTPVLVGLVIAAALAGFGAAGNAALMSASRYPLAMARDRLMPRGLARVHPRLGTPITSILLTTGLMVVLIVSLSEEGVAKLASSTQLMLFGLMNLAVIVMRESRIHSYDPGFRSPLYPWVQLVGMAASFWLIVEIGALSAAFTIGVAVLGIGWYIVFSASRVERQGAVYHVFHRLGKHRFDELDTELRGIMKEKGLREQDPYDEIVARASVIDAGPGMSYDDLVEGVSGLLAERLEVSAEGLVEGLRQGARLGATPVSHGAALPHVRVAGIEHPEMVLVRSKEGICLDPTGDVARKGQPVWAWFFLASPDDDPALHLRILAQLAGRVDDDDFLDAWLAAEHGPELREVLLRDERFLLVRIDGDRPAGSLAGTSLRDLGLPPGCLVALIRREPHGTMIPSGDTRVELGDRLTVIGEPAGIRELGERFG